MKLFTFIVLTLKICHISRLQKLRVHSPKNVLPWESASQHFIFGTGVWAKSWSKNWANFTQKIGEAFLL